MYESILIYDLINILDWSFACEIIGDSWLDEPQGQRYGSISSGPTKSAPMAAMLTIAARFDMCSA